jgi:hypothetical protein
MYVEQLRNDPRELSSLYEDLLIGVTRFFRDEEAFETLEHRIVPELVERTEPREQIRVWVPGCATGQEAYSIAMLLHEASECGVHLMTPFAGFCAFSAGYVLGYVYRFPKMNLGRSPRAEEYMNMCLNYLEEFRHVWPIADGWVRSISAQGRNYVISFR